MTRSPPPGSLAARRLGPYELVRRIARGGMADVYLARRVGSAAHVALKVLTPERARDPEARALLEAEARIAAALAHPHIAALVEARADGAEPFLAMEYVHGWDLRALLQAATRRGARIPVAAAAAIIAAAAHGVDHAHAARDAHGAPLEVVHRDLSLGNVMVGVDGTVKIVDFGIASSTLTRVATAPGIVRGTAAYMAPEQCLGQAVDRRADVFALGVLLYELATGRRCFGGRSDHERMITVVRGEYRLPREVAPELPAALEAIICTALASDPELRYPTAGALARALGHLAARLDWALAPSAIAAALPDLFEAAPQRAPAVCQTRTLPDVAIAVAVDVAVDDDVRTGRRAASPWRPAMAA